MKTVSEHIRDHLLREVMDDPPEGLTDEAALKKTQWSEEFERLMRNRLLVGAYRYGSFGLQKRTVRHRNVESAMRRLRRYVRDGNQEDLVDAANLLLVEFVAPGSHPDPHFHSTDDGEEHVQVG